MLSNIRGETYEERLKDAGLTTLRERRERGDVIEAFKTLNGINNVDKNDWFEIQEIELNRPSTRSNTLVAGNGEEERWANVVLHERARTDLRNQSYRFRTARARSEIPETVKNVGTTNAFKTAYDKWSYNKKNPTESIGI